MKISDWVGGTEDWKRLGQWLVEDWDTGWFVRIYKQALHAMSPKLDLLPNSRTDALRKLLSK